MRYIYGGVINSSSLFVPCDQNDGEIRLIGPEPDAGRLEIFNEGHWGTVCGMFSAEAAR